MLQNQDHVHPTHKCTTPTLGVGEKHVIPPRSTQKCSTPTLGVNTKNYYLGFPPNKCSKFLLLSLKSSIAEKGMGYAKVI